MTDHQPATEPEVESVLASVPEFAGPYMDLVRDADGDPGGASAFGELADFVASLADDLDGRRPLLERCLRAVEAVAASSPDAVPLVGWAFLDSLSPEEATALRPLLGPCTTELLDRLDELGIFDDDSDDDEHEDDLPEDDRSDGGARTMER